jgi:DNA ligase-1
MKTATLKPMLARHYDYRNPTGYWLSEKVDGCRSLFDGENFISRSGKIFPAPAEMKEAMPKGMILDGEIHGGIGSFQATVGRIRRGDWLGLRYAIFDVISEGTLEERQALLGEAPLPAFCEVLEQTQCTGHDHLDRYEAAILEKGGEGVMLRKPQSLYQHRRSSDLMKLKRSQSAEAVVIDHAKGHGKHAGRCGALVAEYQGKLFKLGTGLSDEQRENPPAVGEFVTFSFFELTRGGTPRFPVFVATRNYE